jgi:hypothetical protein
METALPLHESLDEAKLTICNAREMQESFCYLLCHDCQLTIGFVPRENISRLY